MNKSPLILKLLIRILLLIAVIPAFGQADKYTILMDSLPELMKLHGGNPNSPTLWQDLCHGLYSMNDFIYLR